MIEIIEVNNKKTHKDFFENVYPVVYEKDKNFVYPIIQEIKDIFNPKLNPFYNHGEAALFVAYQNNKPVGRVAVFIDHHKKIIDDLPTGGIGFFETIENYEVAEKIFDAAKEWLQNKGMKAMLGNINFAENDKFWGLLIEGFENPSYGMNYNLPYYKNFFEKYGFVYKYNQITNVIDLNKPFTDRFTKIADWVMKKPEYEFKKFSKANYKKFVDDLIEIYNDAWVGFENFMPLKTDIVLESFRKMKTIIKEELIYYAYHNGEPVSFIITVPDINPILKKLKGKMNLLNKLRFLYYFKTMNLTRQRVIVMGTKQKFQNKGLESALIRKLQIEVEKEKNPNKKIKYVELAWVGDFNKKMLAIHEATGADKVKVHCTMKCIF